MGPILLGAARAVRLGYDQALPATVAESLARAVMQDMRGSVKERHSLTSVEPLHAGVFTVVQRFRSDLGLYGHLHCLVTTELSTSTAPKCASCPPARRPPSV